VKQIEKWAGDYPACGYGLLGLCCSACLLGPCRLTPFDEDSTKGLCGDDRDRMVAKNLLHLAIRETSRVIKDFNETVLKTGSLSLASPLVKESKNLLSLFPERVGSLISSLYPEKVFPPVRQIFQGRDFPPKSLISVLLDSVDVSERESSGVEEILTRSLQISLLALIGEELRKDMSQLVDGGRLAPEDRKISEALECLPSTPCSVIIHLSDDDLPITESLNERGDELRQKLEATAPVISIKEGRALLEIGRRLFKRWALSVTDLKSIVLISSRRATFALGALALGYSVVSFPPLPIHGSARAEKFFCEDFQRIFGNAYLPAWEENVIANILERLKGLV